MASSKSNNDMYRTRGFKTPMSVGSAPGDSFKPPTAPARGGPPRDPLGIKPGGGGRKGLPVGK